MIKEHWFSGAGSVSAAIVLWLVTAGSASAYESDWLEVRVTDQQTGHAIVDAAVCLGTSANPDQFGARRTDDKGAVRFADLLSDSLLVTVSGQGYKGREQRVERGNQARVLVLKLTRGGGGPHCDAPLGSTPADQTPGLSIDGVSIRKDPGDSGRILLSVRTSGPANQVRISEVADFAGSDWQELQQPVSYQLAEGQGVRQIYVQVRRHAQAQGASIEVISPVEKVGYRP